MFYKIIYAYVRVCVLPELLFIHLFVLHMHSISMKHLESYDTDSVGNEQDFQSFKAGLR